MIDPFSKTRSGGFAPDALFPFCFWFVYMMLFFHHRSLAMPPGIKKTAPKASAKTKVAPKVATKAAPSAKAKATPAGASRAKAKTTSLKTTSASLSAGKTAPAGKVAVNKTSPAAKSKAPATRKPIAAGSKFAKAAPVSKPQGKTAPAAPQTVMSEEQRQKRDANLERTISTLRAKNRAMTKTITAMTTQIADLEAANARHEQKAKRMNAANAKAKSASKAVAEAASATQDDVLETEGSTDLVTVSAGESVEEFTPLEEILDHSA